MNKKIIFLLIVIFSFTLVNAQNQSNKAQDIRHRVQLQELAYDNELFANYTTQITENVATNLKSTNRANVFLAKSEGAVEQTIDDSFNEDDNRTWIASKSKLVKYTIHGSINSIKFIKMGIEGYKGVVSFTLRIIDNATKDVVAQQEFKSSSAPAEIAKTTAFPSALRTTNEAQKEFFKSFFTLRATILKIDKKTKSSASHVIITAGATSGLVKKDQFVVKQIEEVDGFEIENEIATLKVKEIGTSTTKCQVAKGGKDILSLFDANNRESLICELKTKKR